MKTIKVIFTELPSQEDGLPKPDNVLKVPKERAKCALLQFVSKRLDRQTAALQLYEVLWQPRPLLLQILRKSSEWITEGSPCRRGAAAERATLMREVAGSIPCKCCNSWDAKW